MSLPPILLYPGGRRKTRPATPRPILNARGQDIRPALLAAAEAAGIPARLVLACAIAESELNPRAERWGRRTDEARAAIAAGNRTALNGIVGRAWPDISFGYGQRIVKYHYVGDGSRTLENVLSVRQYVFDHPEEDLAKMASFLAQKLAQAAGGDLGPCGGDVLLGALVAYNCGHYPKPGERYWLERSTTVARYRDGLERAKAALAEVAG